MNFLWGNVMNRKKAHFPHKFKKKKFSFGICLISWLKMWVTLNSMSKRERVSVKIWETLGGDQGPFTVRGLRLEVTTRDSPLSSEAISALRKHCRTFIHSPKICQRVTHSPGTVLRILNKTSKTLYILMGSDRQEVLKQAITNTASC